LLVALHAAKQSTEPDRTSYIYNHPFFVISAGSWLHTPACTSAPFPDQSVADSHFKVWGWDGGHLCAYKDDQQRPTPINKANNQLPWVDAPACTQDPEPTINNAVPDRQGCLWGWQLDRCVRGAVLQAANFSHLLLCMCLHPAATFVLRKSLAYSAVVHALMFMSCCKIILNHIFVSCKP
jgi:hypothetical protein